MNWIEGLVKQHEELESPKSFWFWSGLAAISAVMRDQVWLDRAGIFKTYANIYVMLHAESGMKKGPPIAMAKQLVKPIPGTKIITGRSSIQGILKTLGTAHSQPGGKVLSKSVAFICSSELSSSIVEDKVATKILTDLYDRQYNEGEWKSLLKMEEFQLRDPTVSMLTATNDAMAEDFFTKSAIQGGFFARTFMIYEKSNVVSNSLTFDLLNPPNYSTLSDYLRELAKLNGPFEPFAVQNGGGEYRYKRTKFGRDVWFNEVGSIYDDWYERFRIDVKEQEVKDDTGTLNRFGDAVLKVAMLLSLAEKPELIITPAAMTEAISQCERLLGNVRRTTLGKQGISQSAILKTLIINELYDRENHQVSREILMRKMWMHYAAAEEFDNLMLSFHHAGLIETSNIGNMIVYTMPERQVGELKRFMEGRTKK